MLTVEEKYQLYENSVQCHDADIDFINAQFETFSGRKPLVLREDFGGTGMLACNWTKQSPEHLSYAVDLDPEPIAYGKKTHFQTLNEEEKTRMHYVQGNVLDSYPFKADVTVAFNFSYFIFKTRKQLVEYFSKVREGLKEDGVFFLDLFGGTDAYEESVEETEHDSFSYFWDCDKYNPITNECQYYIHFEKMEKGMTRYFLMIGGCGPSQS